MNYSNNEVSIYTNTCQKIKEETNYLTTLNNYNELMELIYLFSINSSDSCKLRLKQRQKDIDASFKPKLKEEKRLLTNTLRRIQYHNNKCQ
jgi:cell division protein ZapA (FtsZ GTPase activity inhibitor)